MVVAFMWQGILYFEFDIVKPRLSVNGLIKPSVCLWKAVYRSVSLASGWIKKFIPWLKSANNPIRIGMHQGIQHAKFP